MKRMSFLLAFLFGIFANSTAKNNIISTISYHKKDSVNYYKGEGETIALNGILYKLNSDRTATAIGSPTTETGYSELKLVQTSNYPYREYKSIQHSPTTFELKNYLDSCDGVFSFPEYIEKDGTRYTLTEISIRDNPDLFDYYAYGGGSIHYKNTYAWQYCGKINLEIVVPKTVTSIDYAFGGTNKIKKVTVHNNLRIIGDAAFSNGLTTLKVVEKGETGDSIVVLPDALDSIGVSAFSADQMKLVQCNKNLRYIGWDAFSDCNYLQSFDMPEAITAIFTSTFQDCSELKSINLRNVTTIGNYAFQNCYSLTDIDLSKVDSIGMWAFVNCKRLEKVNIPNVTQILERTFMGCTSLKDIGDLSNLDCLGTQAFKNCSSLTSVNPINVSRIYDETFSGCSSLGTAILANTDTIGKKAFYDCTSLKTVDLSKVSYIGNEAFYNCKRLRDVDLSNVLYFGEDAFSNCLKLETADLRSAEYVGKNAFSGLTLKDVLIPTMAKFGSSPFYQSKLSSIIFEEGMDTLRAWLEDSYINNIEIPEGVKHIEQYALCFSGMNGKKPTITLPSTLKSMESCPFGYGYLQSQYQWKPSGNTLMEIDKLIIKSEKRPELLNSNKYYYPLGLKPQTTIYVPKGTSKKYKNDEIWGEYNILEMSELTGVNGVTVDDATEQGTDDGIYYDMQGRRVTTPQKGVYILQGKKVMVK